MTVTLDRSVEAFIAATRADIRHGGDKACFVPALDFINLPPPSSFKSIEPFYTVALHELGHWSGIKPRLDRDLSARFGTRAYAAEELVAEFTAAFLCAHLGIVGELRHAGYIENWLDLLRHDDRAIFVGEAMGLWLWAIVWPATAGVLMYDDLSLIDLREAEADLVLDFGALSPRLSALPDEV